MMESKMVKLGDYIEQCDERNSKGDFSLDSVRGISIEKKMIFTKANMEGVSLKPYKLFKPKEFCFVTITSRNGNKITLSMNYEEDTYLVSSSYVVFKIKDKNLLLPDYLYLLFCRPEFDRYARFNSWGSAREAFSYEDMCRVEIPLPSLAEQQKVVNAWKALREIKEQNEEIAAPLMQVCQSYIQELKHSATCDSVRIGDFIKVNEITNKENKAYSVLGLNKAKSFMPTVANTESVNLKNYKVVSHGMFAYSGMQTGRDLCIRIAYYDEENPCLISPAYTTFNIDESKGLLAEYFMMIFKRSEMDRLGWFYSDSSVRSNLDWERFVEIEIPLPPLSVQQAIVNIYNCANEAKKIAEEADRMSREVCPALIQHSINNN